MHEDPLKTLKMIQIVSVSIGETQSMSTCDQDGLIQFWNISSNIPTPLWTYSDGVNIPICSSVNRDYVIIGTMLGKLLGMISVNGRDMRIVLSDKEWGTNK